MNRSRMNAVGTVVALTATVAAVACGPLSSAQAGTGSTGYTLTKVELASGKSVAARWNPCQTAITYRVNLAGLPKARRAAMLRQVKTGFATLSAADGIRYRYAGTTTFVPQKQNLATAPAEIVVAAVSRSATDLDMAASAVGFGGMQWSTWSGGHGEGAAVVRGFVILSPSGMAALKPGFGAGRTQGNVLLHELGHASGLEHTSAKNELMNPVLTEATPNGYGRGDLAGLKKIGRPAGRLHQHSGRGSDRRPELIPARPGPVPGSP